MNAKLYLGEITQDAIEMGRFKKGFVDTKLTFCCDGFCCIIDCSKRINPGDLVSNPPDIHPALKGRKTRLSMGLKRKELSWMFRKEDFGGLLWNLRTGHVFELDEEAYTVVNDLSKGQSVSQISEKKHMEQSSIHQMLGDISKKYQVD